MADDFARAAFAVLRRVLRFTHAVRLVVNIIGPKRVTRASAEGSSGLIETAFAIVEEIVGHEVFDSDLLQAGLVEIGSGLVFISDLRRLLDQRGVNRVGLVVADFFEPVERIVLIIKNHFHAAGVNTLDHIRSFVVYEKIAPRGAGIAVVIQRGLGFGQLLIGQSPERRWSRESSF